MTLTAKHVRAESPLCGPYIETTRDELGGLCEDETFTALLLSPRGQPAEAPWRLALVMVPQFAADLSDRRAAEAERARIDWKPALSHPSGESGFDASVLRESSARPQQSCSQQVSARGRGI